MVVHNSRYLLLVGCSQRKAGSTGKHAAIVRYDGVNYRVLRKLQREGRYPTTLDVLIISAKFGLLDADTPIENYDLRMTPTRAVELQDQVGAVLDARLREGQYAAVFINAGKVYQSALGRSVELPQLGGRAIYPDGGIGMKMAAMRRWILQLPG